MKTSLFPVLLRVALPLIAPFCLGQTSADHNDKLAQLPQPWAKPIHRIADRKSRAQGLLRVVDESGEDYLYPARYFCPIIAPKGLFQSRPR